MFLHSWDRGIPEFLRLYTAGSVYTRIKNQGVEILQKLKQYPQAVTLLEELIEQDLYCQNYRGFWYERLALNLEAHLKSPAMVRYLSAVKLVETKLTKHWHHSTLIHYWKFKEAFFQCLCTFSGVSSSTWNPPNERLIFGWMCVFPRLL